MMTDTAENICIECTHAWDSHDGIGCNEEIGFQPCYCTTAKNFHTDEPEDGVYAR